MRWFIGLVAAVVATPAFAQPAPPPAAPDYGDAKNWLCLPGRADLCSRGIEIAPLTAQGWGKPAITRPAAAPAIDGTAAIRAVRRPAPRHHWQSSGAPVY